MRRLPGSPKRGKDITIDLEGEAIPAVEGEPVAAALAAAGEGLLARSIKYHRPRGAFCFSGGCSHCLMRVDGVPNVQTCRVPARAGMKLERQNAYPSGKLDVFGAVDFLFPQGMDHHEMFAGVPVVEQVMLRVARQLAGLGKLPDRSPGARPPARSVHTKVLVLGGGASGLAAAAELARAGTDFLLLEREGELGGRLVAGPPEADAPAVPELPAARVRTHCTALGLYDDAEGRFVLAVHRGAEGTLLLKVYAERLIVALGGHPQLVPFENNDLPGVYAGRAVSRLLRRHGMAPERAAVVGWGGELDTVSRMLQAAGVEVVATVTLRGHGAQPGHEAKAHGRQSVTGFSWVREDGKRAKVGCDAVVVAAPVQPGFELARQAGAKLRFDGEAGVFVVEADADGRTAAEDIFVVGEVTGPHTAAESAASGARAARAVLGGLS